MSKTVIQAENISKFYRLGTIGSGSLRRDLQSWWSSQVLRKEDPYADTHSTMPGQADHIWALRNVDFEIKEGESWGIIGANGAGKSTLLKILSRIVKPTSGIVRGRGKISSLLEVGTGFHPELTGRENIFISGHMLGMKKAEIIKKFDEIVEFSGVSAFLDTPVKRYSSGMYVRLAFAVAAHLEPDILIVDEVLAVGDAEFQKKCLGKMNDATRQNGRTLIFVSHNLQAVSNLCSKAIWLEKGHAKRNGDVKSVVNSYLSTMQTKLWKQEYLSLRQAPGNEYIRVLSVELVPHLEDPLGVIDIRTSITVKFKFYSSSPKANLSTDLLLYTISGECVFDIPSKPAIYNEGFIEGECTIPGNFLNDGAYYLSLYFVQDTSRELFDYQECLQFEVADYRPEINWYDKWWGYVRPNFPLLLKPVVADNSIIS
ncbi:MAG: transporter [Pedobacter sp.]|jgi:lipopolysaccharide transport system ATP-binding protein|nr:transporter [Pedobacter sp.]